MNKSPLAYVARSQVAVKPHAMDPDIDYENGNQEMTSPATHDQYVYGAENKNRVNMERNGKKIVPYWLFLREYCSPLNSRNGRNDTYTLKRFNQAGYVATTRRTTRLPSR